jgi:hypothetical protein
MEALSARPSSQQLASEAGEEAASAGAPPFDASLDAAASIGCLTASDTSPEQPATASVDPNASQWARLLRAVRRAAGSDLCRFIAPQKGHALWFSLT